MNAPNVEGSSEKHNLKPNGEILVSIVRDFLVLCRDAEKFINEMKDTKKPEALKLQGKKPSILKVSAIRYLAKKRGIKLTLHNLYLIYGISPHKIIETEKIFKDLNR